MRKALIFAVALAVLLPSLAGAYTTETLISAGIRLRIEFDTDQDATTVTLNEDGVTLSDAGGADSWAWYDVNETVVGKISTNGHLQSASLGGLVSDLDTHQTWLVDFIKFTAGGQELFIIDHNDAGQNEVLVNDGGADINFRAEGVGDANTLVVDASTSRVGIGTATPNAKFHVYTGSSGATPVAATVMAVEHSADAGISILSGATNEGSVFFGDSGNADDGYLTYDHNTQGMAIGANGATRMTISGAGAVFMPDVYSNSVNSSNIDIFMDDSGEIGADGSSLRFKENVREVAPSDRSLARQIIALLKKYDRKDGGFDGEIGLIAEEMYALAPRFVACEMDVAVNEDGSIRRTVSNRPLSVRWHRVTPFLFATLGHEVQVLKQRESLQRRQIEWFRTEAGKRGWDMGSFPLQ